MPQPKSVMTAEDYWALPEGERSELIDGELWGLAAPSRMHQKLVSAFNVRMSNFIANHRGSCEVYPAPFAVNLFADESTFVEPDISIICDSKKLSDRGCEGAPDLVVEIVSPSSRGMDYQTKQNLYAEAGVREYWIVDPSMRRTMVTRFSEDPAPIIYPFTAPVPSHVLLGFEIECAPIVEGA